MGTAKNLIFNSYECVLQLNTRYTNQCNALVVNLGCKVKLA